MPGAFKVGDVVRLKSGGSRMTIEKVDGDDVLCVWFEGAKVERAIFLYDTLKAVTDQNQSL